MLDGFPTRERERSVTRLETVDEYRGPTLDSVFRSRLSAVGGVGCLLFRVFEFAKVTIRQVLGQVQVKSGQNDGDSEQVNQGQV